MRSVGIGRGLVVLECFGVNDVSDVEMCTFVDGEVEEVDSFRGVLMCEMQV